MTPWQQVVYAVKMLPWMYLQMVVWVAALFTVGLAIVGLVVAFDLLYY